jgi:hypothetical protein
MHGKTTNQRHQLQLEHGTKMVKNCPVSYKVFGIMSPRWVVQDHKIITQEILPQPNENIALREPVRQLEQVKGDARRGSALRISGRGHAAPISIGGDLQ